MKEYIERNLAIKALKKSLELVQNTEVHEEENDYKAGAIDARRDDISNIKSLPVVKVNMNVKEELTDILYDALDKVVPVENALSFESIQKVAQILYENGWGKIR